MGGIKGGVGVKEEPMRVYELQYSFQVEALNGEEAVGIVGDAIRMPCFETGGIRKWGYVDWSCELVEEEEEEEPST